MHVAFESLWPQSLRTETASLPIITSTSTRVPHKVLGLCVLIPQVHSMARQGFWTPVRMTQTITGQNLGRRGCCPCHGGGHGSLLLVGLRVAQARDRNLGPVLEGALRLLHDSDVEDVLQLAVHPVHPIREGVGKVSRSAAAVAMFWLALAKVGCCIPSQLMATVTSLARAPTV
jgi:hypothetical protein